MKPVIDIDHVTKSYRARTGTRVLLGKGGIGEKLRGKKRASFNALEDVTFSVEDGESLGIIGANGSGKSTLLKLIAGVTVPSEGTVSVHGRVASLLELGAGFHPMLTGRENVYLNAGILGMRHRQVDEVFDDIVEFSGIGRFIDQPVDTYSSGMYVRIAFSVAAYTNPDIFLIDEVLSVGDEEFQRRCRRRIGELMDMGKTIVFVSHDLGIVNTLCERVILLSQGKMIMRDTTSKAIDFYLRQIGEEKGLHTMSEGGLEVIVCNGRISIFRDQEEVTAASGLQFQLFYMGSWYFSEDAEWTISEKTEHACVAEGYWTKLGVSIIWSIALEDEELHWRIGLRAKKSIAFNKYECNMFFPTQFDEWMFDDTNGIFQAILPDDTNYLAATSPELLFETAALLSGEHSNVSTLGFQATSSRFMCRASWHNSDFMTGCRVLRVEESPSSDTIVLQSGDTPLIEFTLSPNKPREALEAKLGERNKKLTVESGKLRARFDRGHLRLSHNADLLSSELHFYTSALIQNIWHDSINLRWDSGSRDEECLHVEGESRRVPMRQMWDVEPIDGGIRITIFIEAMEDINIQEYHASILLRTAYAEWKTEHESGVFPDIDHASNDWVHLNSTYNPSTYIEASGDGVPTLHMHAHLGDVATTMTALNTSFEQKSRVLQALRLPDQGSMHVSKGTHPFFTVELKTT